MVDFDTVSLEVGYFGYAFYDENTLTSDDVSTLEQVAENYFCEAREKINFINNSYEIKYLKTYKEQLQELYLKILKLYNYGEDE